MTIATPSRNDKGASLELLKRRKARETLLNFTRYTMPNYEVKWFHRLLCTYLDKWVNREIKRLVLNIPPRHGKSELVSRRLPAYIFGKNPDAHVMTICYSASLSSRMNRDLQRVIDSKEYKALFPTTRLYGKNIRTMASGTYMRNSDLFEIVNHKGSYRSAGVGGGIVGMGFDYGIIDDPVKGRAEANSQTYSERDWQWYAGVFYTRQHKDASILINMTRWSPHDMTGRVIDIMEHGGEKFTVLNLPAIAKGELHPEDPREEGEPLWGERYPLEFLEQVRMNNWYEFDAQYQGKPPALSGGLFDAMKIEIVDYIPECTRVVRFYDLAVTKKKHSDYTAGILMGVTSDNRPVILDLYHNQGEMPEIEKAIVQNAGIDGRGVHIRLEAEKAGIVQLQYLLLRPELNMYTIDAVPPIGDKYTRASPFATRVNNKQCLMVRGEWNRKVLDELSMFSRSTSIKDDIVDACSGAWDYLNDYTTEMETSDAGWLLDPYAR